LSVCYLAVLRVLQLIFLLFRSAECKEFEIVVLRVLAENAVLFATVDVATRTVGTLLADDYCPDLQPTRSAHPEHPFDSPFYPTAQPTR
jgi:hypothetical protein